MIVLLSNKKKTKKKKKKTKDREEYGCTDGRTVRDEDLFFSVLNEDVDRRIQIQDCYNVNVLFQRERETERMLGDTVFWH